jgi:hypothetical protein
MATKTIDCTPTWNEILPLLLHMLKQPATRKTAEEQLQRMAQAADAYNAACKASA